MSAAKKEEPKLVDSMFLSNGDQVCIWSDGVATLVNTDKGDEIISVRRAKRLLSQARGAST